VLPAWAVAAVLAATAAIRVEVPQDGRPQRVSVIGLDAAARARLSAAGPADLARALAVYTDAAHAHSGMPAIAGAHAVDGEGLHFTPRFPFVAGLGYHARFDLDGLRIERAFAVEPIAVEPPRVTAVHPSGASLPANALRLYVHFSRPMEAHGAHRHVQLLDEDGREVPLAFVEVENGLWDPGQTRLTLLFHPGRVKRGVAPGERLGPVLREGHRYRLVVDGALADAAGTALGTPYEHAFTAAAADRTAPRAADLRVQAPEALDGPLAVDLPEPLDHALLQRWMWVEDARGERVDGVPTVSADEGRWSFAPAMPWTSGRYAVCLHPGLEDRAGNRFDRLFDRQAGEPAHATATPVCLPWSAALRHGGCPAGSGPHFTPTPTTISQGPSKPFGPSKRASSRAISSQAAFLPASSRPFSIWCRAPNDSRSNRRHSLDAVIRSGAGILRVTTGWKPAFAKTASRTPGPPRLNGPGWPGTGGPRFARRRMTATGMEKNAFRSAGP